jgi:hypothetical protein
MSLEDEIRRQAVHTRSNRAQQSATDEWLRGAVKEFNGLVAEAAQILRSREVPGTPVAVRHEPGFMGKPKHTITRQRAWVPTGPGAIAYAFTDQGLFACKEFVLGGNGALKIREGLAAGMSRFDRYVVLGPRPEDLKDNGETPGLHHLGRYFPGAGQPPTLRLATPHSEYGVEAREWLTSGVASLLP